MLGGILSLPLVCVPSSVCSRCEELLGSLKINHCLRFQSDAAKPSTSVVAKLRWWSYQRWSRNHCWIISVMVIANHNTEWPSWPSDQRIK